MLTLIVGDHNVRSNQRISVAVCQARCLNLLISHLKVRRTERATTHGHFLFVCLDDSFPEAINISDLIVVELLHGAASQRV